VGGIGSVEPTQTFVCRCMYHLELMRTCSDERTAVDDKKEPRDVRRRHDVSSDVCKASLSQKINGRSEASVLETLTMLNICLSFLQCESK